MSSSFVGDRLNERCILHSAEEFGKPYLSRFRFVMRQNIHPFRIFLLQKKIVALTKNFLTDLTYGKPFSLTSHMINLPH